MELITAAKAKSLPNAIRKSACIVVEDSIDDHSTIVDEHKDAVSESC